MSQLEEFVPLTQVTTDFIEPHAPEVESNTSGRQQEQAKNGNDSNACNPRPKEEPQKHSFDSLTPSDQVFTVKTSAKRKPFSFPRPSKQISKDHWTRTSYFTIRQKKLEAQAPKSETEILSGSVVYFTGVKSVSQRKLEALVWRNGGVVQKVWLRRQVTHVIADNLAASKVEKELQLDAKNSAVVVKPTWITESLKSGEKLPTWPFRVVKGPPDVKDVASYFKLQKGNKKGNKTRK